MNARYLPWVSVGSTLFVVLLLCASTLVVIEKAKHRAAAQLAQIEPRYARLLGLSTAGSKVQEHLAAQQQQVAEYLYPATDGVDRLGASIQQKLRDLIGGAGLNITGSQVLPPRSPEKQPYKIIEVNISVSGDLSQLRAALQAVQAVRPSIDVSSLQIFPQRSASPADSVQQINAAIRFSALYAVAP